MKLNFFMFLNAKIFLIINKLIKIWKKTFNALILIKNMLLKKTKKFFKNTYYKNIIKLIV